jgi:hypothetical protein
MDLMLDRMANRGMDGVGIWMGGCYPHQMDHYAFHLLIKGTSQVQIEQEYSSREPDIDPEEIRRRARQTSLVLRQQLLKKIMDRYFYGLEIHWFDGDLEKCRIPYRLDKNGEEIDFRSYGETDPGYLYLFFVRVRPE